MADNDSNLKDNDQNDGNSNKTANDEIIRLKLELEQCQAESAKKDEEIATKDNLLETCRAELATKTKELSECQAELATKTKELSECQAELATKTKQLTECQAELATKTKELETTREDLAKAQKDLKDLQETCNSDVNPEFKTFVNEAQFITAEVSKTNEAVNNNIVSNFLNQHYVRNDEGVYEPKMVRFKIGNSIKQIPSSSLSNNSNLTPCSLSLNYKPKTQEGSLYDIDTNICFDSKGVGFIDKLVASNGETVIDLTPGIPIDNNISRRNLRSTNI